MTDSRDPFGDAFAEDPALADLASALQGPATASELSGAEPVLAAMADEIARVTSLASTPSPRGTSMIQRLRGKKTAALAAFGVLAFGGGVASAATVGVPSFLSPDDGPRLEQTTSTTDGSGATTTTAGDSTTTTEAGDDNGTDGTSTTQPGDPGATTTTVAGTTCDGSNHGEHVSQTAHDSSTHGRDHGQAVSDAAHSDCGKGADDSTDSTDTTDPSDSTSTTVEDQGHDSNGDHHGHGHDSSDETATTVAGATPTTVGDHGGQGGGSDSHGGGNSGSGSHGSDG